MPWPVGKVFRRTTTARGIMKKLHQGYGGKCIGAARNGLLVMVLVLTGCAAVRGEPPLVIYGQVVAAQPRQVLEQHANPTGAVVGGVAGGVLGNQFGKGNGKKAMTVLGALAGAAAGSQVGKREDLRSVMDLQVRMPDGAVVPITTSDVGFRIGQTVKITQQGKQATIEAVN